MGVQVATLGGEGSCGNCGYICFQEQAFEQLILDENKKELIRAMAHNARSTIINNTNFLADCYQLNGRQIKNSIVLARALARECGMPFFMTVCIVL